MRQWEYLRLDLNEAPRRSDETAMLNTSGNDGWELVTVTGNGIAILKREIPEPPKAGRRKAGDASG
jgi:hypothetical protein